MATQREYVAIAAILSWFKDDNVRFSLSKFFAACQPSGDAPDSDYVARMSGNVEELQNGSFNG